MPWTHGLTLAASSLGIASLAVVGLTYVLDEAPPDTRLSAGAVRATATPDASATDRWVAADPLPTPGRPERLRIARTVTMDSRALPSAAALAAIQAQAQAVATVGTTPPTFSAADDPTGASSAAADPTAGSTTGSTTDSTDPTDPTGTGGTSATATPSSPVTAPGPAGTSALDFSLTTFNMLGASHTAPHGNKTGWASGTVRASRAAVLLARHRTDVAGFQELQGPQLSVLEHSTDLDFYPGFSLGHLGTDNSLGWRSDEWTAVEKHTIAIPYFGGHPRQMPYVLLRSQSTGVEAWFVNVHNPADTRQHHHQQAFRTRATQLEIALVNRLLTTGRPVFLTGDMNERAPYFCRLTAGAPMVAARGGSTTDGRCSPGRPRAVDWIFGSRGVDFTGYDEDRSPLVDITTDHPVVTAEVHLLGTDRRAGGN